MIPELRPYLEKLRQAEFRIAPEIVYELLSKAGET
jgi:predicted nucleic acid-binding protein